MLSKGNKIIPWVMVSAMGLIVIVAFQNCGKPFDSRLKSSNKTNPEVQSLGVLGVDNGERDLKALVDQIDHSQTAAIEVDTRGTQNLQSHLERDGQYLILMKDTSGQTCREKKPETLKIDNEANTAQVFGVNNQSGECWAVLNPTRSSPEAGGSSSNQQTTDQGSSLKGWPLMRGFQHIESEAFANKSRVVLVPVESAPNVNTPNANASGSSATGAPSTVSVPQSSSGTPQSGAKSPPGTEVATEPTANTSRAPASSSETTKEAPGGKGASAPPSNCSNTWMVLAADKNGWMTNPVQGYGPSTHRFSIAKAPDGTQAVQHTIKKGETINKLGHDSPIFLPKSRPCAIMLRYKQFTEKDKHRTQPGKYMALMGGRGQAGGYYENKPGVGPEGWSHYLNSPVVSGKDGTANAKNGLRGVIGSANRSSIGASCVAHSSARLKSGDVDGGNPIENDKNRCYEALYGSTPVFNTGRWVNIEVISVMNDKSKDNGAAYFTVDGKKFDSGKKVMWMKDPDKSPEIYARWRMMYGGNPESLPPAYDLKEWYKDFEILVAYPK